MNSKIPLNVKMMDISLNLARIGDWAADDYQGKKELIQLFLNQTNNYIGELTEYDLSEDISEVTDKLKMEISYLNHVPIDESNNEKWAEKALTWANILQHRAKLV